MKLPKLKQKRRKFLEDTLTYYSADVSRRALEIDSISGKARCKYKTSEGKKCAIGRYIPDEKYDRNIEGVGIVIEKVYSLIPQEVLELGTDFLLKMQLLHDCDDNWNNHGLSDPGNILIGQIEEEFML